MSDSAPYKASMRAKKLQTQELMREFKAIESKVTEINNQLASISQRITGIQKQLTDIESKMPVKEKA
jgi:archaellum component FlaC